VVTVAIPVLNGGCWLPEVLAAVRAQRLDDELELLVCDSGSSDGSPELARDAGARLIEPGPEGFHHARTRNLLMAAARGEFVAMLSQDATPASDDWLAALLRGFALAEDVALVHGPYRPRAGCPPLEAARLRRFFASLSPDGAPRVDRLGPEGDRALANDPSPGYFTDANGCVRRAAWLQVRYPDAPYAEDQALAVAMLRAGWAKAYMPDAAVLHSHHYTPTQQLRRSFDDHRALREVYDYRMPVGTAHVMSQLRGAAGVGLREGAVRAALVDQSLALLGGALGSRSDRLPARVRRGLSLERRASFQPLPRDRPPDGTRDRPPAGPRGQR
jgi:GT2 family glycosyltransferase